MKARQPESLSQGLELLRTRTASNVTDATPVASEKAWAPESGKINPCSSYSSI